jgi:hypothetical protein
MPGLVPGIHVFLFHDCSKQDVDGRDTSAFTRVFDALCPAMTPRVSHRLFQIKASDQDFTPLRIMKLS